MQTEKVLCYTAMIVAGLILLTFVLDATLKLPFGRASLVLDILFALAAAFILWQSIETSRELR